MGGGGTGLFTDRRDFFLIFLALLWYLIRTAHIDFYGDSLDCVFVSLDRGLAFG